MIGIGDDILGKFREEVSEKIEYLTPEEIATRSHLAELEVKQAERGTSRMQRFWIE